MAIYRLTGVAGAVTERRRTAGEGSDRREYINRRQEIVVNPFVQTSVDLGENDRPLREGEPVDLIVQVYVDKGYQRTIVKGEWPKDEADAQLYKVS